jgi:hypothetical protein
MKTLRGYSLAVCALICVACTKSTDAPHDGGATAGRGQSGGTSGKPTGASGTSAGAGCGGVAIPQSCLVCPDGRCGAPTCSGGKFTGFVCDADGGEAVSRDAGTVGVCNLACVRGKHCVANPVATCIDDAPDAAADAGSKPGTGALHWVEGCGSPVCRGDGNFDDPSIPNCTTEKEGQPCTTDGQRCDGVLSCGATLLCAAQAPQTCPKSRARYKQDISYLGEAERSRLHDQITQLRLASYRYKSAPDVPQLGFMIDDVEPSVAVAGDHVNLYAYLSMAVAAIQVQDQEIKALRKEVEELRASRDGNEPR